MNKISLADPFFSQNLFLIGSNDAFIVTPMTTSLLTKDLLSPWIKNINPKPAISHNDNTTAFDDNNNTRHHNNNNNNNNNDDDDDNNNKKTTTA